MRITHEDNHVPETGRFKNVIVVDYATSTLYFYDCKGSFIASELKEV